MKRILIPICIAVISFIAGVFWGRQSPVSTPAGVDSSMAGIVQKPQVTPLRSSVPPGIGGDAANTNNKVAPFQEPASLPPKGQYVLNYEHDMAKTMFNQGVSNQMRARVPGIISTRAGFLAALGVGADEISKLTNHAAKIAEASFRYNGPLVDLQMAKADYRNEMRSLLTPEQFQAYESLERQHAVANQAGIDFSKYSTEDAASIVNLYESLGIGTVKDSFLPFEGLPNSITGGPEITNIFNSRMIQFKAAQSTLESMMSRNVVTAEAGDAIQKFLSAQIEQYTRSVGRILNPPPRPIFRPPGPGENPPQPRF